MNLSGLAEKSVLKEMHLSEEIEGKAGKVVTLITRQIDKNWLHLLIKEVHVRRNKLQSDPYSPSEKKNSKPSLGIIALIMPYSVKPIGSSFSGAVGLG